MSRKKGPALYELISSKQSSPLTRPSTSQPEYRDEDDNLEHNVLTPGRSVRMSIGTIGVLVAVGIALIVVSYTMGFRKGSAIAKEDYGNRLFEELPTTTFTETETLAVDPGSPNTDVESSIDPKATPKNQPSGGSGVTSWGPLQVDPRVAGYYYFTLIETTEKGAVQLATFCRERGLETYVVSGNNTQFHRVVAFPGSKERNTAVAEDVRSKIHAIGREWAKTSAGRGIDLQDAYERLYN